MKLSERLKVSRINRPDEWSMDEYAKQAEELEKQLSDANAAIKWLRLEVGKHDYAVYDNDGYKNHNVAIVRALKE